MKTAREILLDKRAIKETCYIIYALIDKDTIVYIGQSKSILSRLSSHIHSYKKFDSWSIVENLGDDITSKEVNSIEKAYIKRLIPKYNVSHNKNYKLKPKMKYERMTYNLEVKKKKEKLKIWNHIKHIPELAVKFNYNK
jgi:excinuclease UvrABC nuclease subunit|tara:strand:+ start:313 stop:729 length:417 start_codon:yes stop_codon:yes gene_type:complete